MLTNGYQLTLDPEGTVPCTPQFTAGSLSNAQTLAQSISTLLGRTLYLVIVGNVGPWTQYTAGSQGSTVNSPSGISF